MPPKKHKRDSHASITRVKSGRERERERERARWEKVFVFERVSMLSSMAIATKGMEKKKQKTHGRLADDQRALEI